MSGRETQTDRVLPFQVLLELCVRFQSSDGFQSECLPTPLTTSTVTAAHTCCLFPLSSDGLTNVEG